MTQTESTPVFDTISARKSVRTFSDTPVEEGKLAKVLEAARLAPSWANRQCWHFVLVQGKKEVDELGIVPFNIKNTPALVVACGDPKMSGDRDGKSYYLVDVSIAVQQMVLAAWEQGLGAVWVGAFKEENVRKVLGIPEDIKVVALLPIGYPAEKESFTGKMSRRLIGSANRKDLSEIVHKGKW